MADVRELFLGVKSGLSRKTLEQYRWAFDKVDAFGELWPTDTAKVNLLVSSLKVGDVSRRQLFLCLRTISNYLAKTCGWPNPALNAAVPEVKHKDRRYFSDAELQAIFNACLDDKERALVLVLLDSGARIGEVCGLRIEDIGSNFFRVAYEKGKTGARRCRCDERVGELLVHRC